MKSKTGIDEPSCRAGIEIQMSYGHRQRRRRWDKLKEQHQWKLKKQSHAPLPKKKERIKYLGINLPKEIIIKKQ